MSGSEELPPQGTSDEPGRVELATPDLAAENRAALEELFPGVIADGVLDAGRLGELVDTPVTAPAEERERFGLMWAGKQDAVRSLLTPGLGALVPDLHKSVDFDTAPNAFVEGDNLEVLKLLQKAYNDEVKLIYIDPPYNTGKDFVYEDDFSDGLRAYLEYSKQADEEGFRVSANTDTAGRYHSKWLSMMYPRLFLARNLLRADGVIFVSIDDHELHCLRILMDEIFGAENVVGVFVWRKKYTLSFRDEYQIPIHEYILCYKGRGKPNLRDTRWEDESTVAVNPIFKSQNSESTKTIRKGARLKQTVDHTIARGPISLPSQTIEYLDDAVFENGVLASDVRIRGRFSTGQDRIDRSQIEVSASGAAYIVESDDNSDGARTIRPISILFDYTKNDATFLFDQYKYRKGVSTRQATAELEGLLPGKVFDNPKPVELLRALISYVEMADGDVVLDFFAGSGTTAHAVAVQSAADGVERRCISVNLPEPVAPESGAGLAGYRTVADITLARITAVSSAKPEGAAGGLRAYRLAESSFGAATPEPSDLFNLSDSTLLQDAPSLQAVAAEVLLKEGVRLDASWERHTAGTAVVIVADGVAVVLSLDITNDVVTEAFALKPRVVVFLEDGFAGNDAVKANAFTNARNLGMTMKTV
jgi:adenine-specific DNA-methyltransferase